jgi:hypothetical protein
MINSLNYENTTEVLDLWYSDHLIQILHRKSDNPKTGPIIVRKRQLQRRIEENTSTCYITVTKIS